MKRSKATVNATAAAAKGRQINNGVQCEPPIGKKKYNFSKRKAKFKRERDRSSSPEDDVVERHVRKAHVPSSPDAAERRMLRRSKDKPTCLLFGIHREILYPDNFFCSNCKKYEDCVLSGSLNRNSKRNSTQFRCTAEHSDYFLPTHFKKLQYVDRIFPSSSQSHHVSIDIVSLDEKDDSADEMERLEEKNGSDHDLEGYDEACILDDFRTLQESFEGVQRLLLEQENKLSERNEAFVNHVKEAVKTRLTSELLGVHSYIQNLEKNISTLRATVNKQATIINRYKKKLAEKKSESLPLNLGVVKAINELVMSQPRYKLLKPTRLASLIAKAVFDPNLCNGVVLDEVINQAKSWLRKNVFKASEILKQMDLRGGTLNYEGISVLNDVEASSYIGNKRRIRNRLLCTPACLKRVAKKLEQAAGTLCPYRQIRTPFGEGIEFDYAKVTRLVINSFALEHTGFHHPINISASIDAARVTKNLCHTSAGLKMSDPRACDPIKNMRSFMVDGDSLRDLQSHNNVFLMKIILTKETKESFQEFHDIFQFFRLSELPQEQRLSHEKNDEKFRWEHISDLQPLAVTFTTDMAADWKLVGTGGGVKNTEMFCTLCACTSTDVHQPNSIKCDRFCAHEEEDGWCCYHHAIATRELKEGLEDEVRQLRQNIQADLEDIECNSKVRYYINVPLEIMKRTPNCIFYEPLNQDEKDDFLDLLMDELVMRGINPVGDMEAMRDRLMNELVMEHKLRQHLKKLEHCSKLEQSLIVLLHKIPCILHCENRVGLKLLSMVLREGFDNTKKGIMFGHIRSEAERIKTYIELIQNIFNTKILGDDDGPAQWCLPYDNDNKTVGIICLDNNRIRKVMIEYDTLVQASIHDQDRLTKYKTSIHHYRNAMSILREKREFTNEKIRDFQVHVDKWFQLWNELWSFEGCTNYTHMLSSGHMTEFMYKWRNLYRFSQQGWEKFNHIFSTYYFRRTNHGGKRHADGIKSKLVPIARWLQRRLLWLTGMGDDIINDIHDAEANELEENESGEEN